MGRELIYTSDGSDPLGRTLTRRLCPVGGEAAPSPAAGGEGEQDLTAGSDTAPSPAGDGEGKPDLTAGGGAEPSPAVCGESGPRFAFRNQQLAR